MLEIDNDLRDIFISALREFRNVLKECLGE